MYLTIILPTYNERQNLEKLVRSILKVQPCKLIVVDDNSPDGTGNLADRLARKLPITVVHRRAKLGLSSAVAEGLRLATTNIVGVMDADMSHPPDVLPRLMKSLERADIAVASRNVKGGRVEVWPFRRRMVSRVATLLARQLTSVRDPMSGYFVLRKRVIKGIRFDSRGYRILLEILVKGKYSHVVEVPYTFRNRGVGQSKLSLAEYVKYLWDWARLMAARRANHPIGE